MDDNISDCDDEAVSGDFNYSSNSGATLIRTGSSRVAYIASDEYLQICDRLPKVSGRASIVHNLIEAYGLLQHMSIITPSPADVKDLRLFHSIEYISCLQSVSEQIDAEKSVDELEEFGLAYDCPVFADLFNCVKYVAGGSLSAADCLLSGTFDIAINWFGGWHHAKRDEAAGFCYVNDIVLAILKLRQKYSRILYVDLDLHHGDGVEDAFCATGMVLTVSFHKQSPGFFPGTGTLGDVGVGRGKYFAINIPLKDGITNQQYMSVFKRVMSSVNERYRPEAVVCQCGADTLAGDPLACFNLTPNAVSESVQYLMDFKVPMLIVGGGGYHFANTARCWALLTATVLGISLPSEIPEHKYFTKYGPDFELGVTPSYMRNTNQDENIEEIITTVLGNLEHITIN